MSEQAAARTRSRSSRCGTALRSSMRAGSAPLTKTKARTPRGCPGLWMKRGRARGPPVCVALRHAVREPGSWSRPRPGVRHAVHRARRRRRDAETGGECRVRRVGDGGSRDPSRSRCSPHAVVGEALAEMRGRRVAPHTWISQTRRGTANPPCSRGSRRSPADADVERRLALASAVQLLNVADGPQNCSNGPPWHSPSYPAPHDPPGHSLLTVQAAPLFAPLTHVAPAHVRRALRGDAASRPGVRPPMHELITTQVASLHSFGAVVLPGTPHAPPGHWLGRVHTAPLLAPPWQRLPPQTVAPPPRSRRSSCTAAPPRCCRCRRST